jgi:hypothetical protein
MVKVGISTSEYTATRDICVPEGQTFVEFGATLYRVSIWSTVCVVYTQGTAVETQTPTDWNLPQHDGPAACVIAQHYSSAIFVSLRSSFRAGINAACC